MEVTRNHLLLTPEFSVKGTLARVAGRLSDHLVNHERSHLQVLDAETTFFTTFEKAHAVEAEVARDHVLFAHEYVAMSGDPHLQAMNRAPVPDRYRIVMAGAAGLSLVARLRNAAPHSERRFLVVTEPEVKDVGGCPPGMIELLSGLPYLLVNRSRVATFFRV